MTNWLISANPQMYDHASSFEHFSFIDWRQGEGLFQIGDIVFIYTTRPVSTIQYKCVVQIVDLRYPDIRDDKDYWKDQVEYKKSINGKFMRLVLIDQVNNPQLNFHNLLLNGLNGPPQGRIKIKKDLLAYINLNFSDNYQTEVFPEMLYQRETFPEGLKNQIVVNKYERSSIAREKCIEFHGVDCQICHFNFFDVYGDLGENFIHVHHLIPIHTIGKDYKINYKNDLIPVCPNCHAMLHRKLKGKELSIEDLQSIVRGNKSK